MTTTSVDRTKTTHEHLVPNASSCCGGHAGAEATEKTNAHGSCGNHESAAAPDTAVPTSDQDHSVSSAGHHPKKSGCCSGS